MDLNLQENNTPQGMGMGEDTIIESAPVGIGMGEDTIVEDTTPEPALEPTTEEFGIYTPESSEEFGIVDKDLADATLSRIYSTENTGTKSEQLVRTTERYMTELFDLGNSMPQLGSLQESQKVLYEIYEAESKEELLYDSRSSLTREEVDGINGTIRRKKALAAEVRKSMIIPQLSILSIPEGASPDEIKSVQKLVGTKADGIVGPKTLEAIKSYNLDQQMASRSADTQTRIDPETGLVSEDVTGKGLEGNKSVPNTLISHLNKREGSKSTSYLDSLGKLTGGVGHLMTEEEKKRYPAGTEIPKEVRDRWLKEDSAKAFEAAKQQAKELGVVDNKFVEALASVNFQLGTKWNTIHKKTWELMTQKKFDEAAKEAANSTWNKQTPVRVSDFQKALTELKG